MLGEFPSAEEIITARDNAFSNAKQVINDACERFGTDNNVEVKVEERSIKKVDAKPFLESYDAMTKFTAEPVKIYEERRGAYVGIQINMIIDSPKEPIANLEEVFNKHVSTSNKCERTFGYGLEFDVDGGLIRIYQESQKGNGELAIDISPDLIENGKVELIKDIFEVYGIRNARTCINHAKKKWEEYGKIKKNQEESISEVKEILDNHNIDLPEKCIPDLKHNVCEAENIKISGCMNLEYKLFGGRNSISREHGYKIRLSGKDFIQDDTLSGSLKLAKVAEKLGLPCGFIYHIGKKEWLSVITYEPNLYIRQAPGRREVEITSRCDEALKSVLGGKE